MNRRTPILLSVTALLLCSSGLAQTRQTTVTDCRIGTINVITSQGSVSVRAHGRLLDLFGRSVKTDDLATIVTDGLRPTTAEKFDCDDQRFLGAAYLLSTVKDARALGPFLEISASSCPLSCSAAVGGLANLGDRRALPRLLEILRQHDECSWAAVQAIAKIGDETAVDDLIETIPAGGAMDTEARLKAIEEITSLSLAGMRAKWGLLFYDNLPQYHAAMREWWRTHKHLAKIKKA